MMSLEGLGWGAVQHRGSAVLLLFLNYQMIVSANDLIIVTCVVQLFLVTALTYNEAGAIV